ncbi:MULTISPECIES: hypothetical protein [unclassified Nocardioides]|uniref:hypothetical protein n=1 Tax=unclassified Nocardioides TaxID=2615069 RepID=UPI0012E3877D|nr:MULTISPECIES: hypothetical protein [unclassified Nocardioides]
MTEGLGALVRKKWSPLIAEGFEIAEEDAHRVVLESHRLTVVAIHYPRGEVDVRAFPPGTEEHYGWSYSGMAGTASVGRLLEIAHQEMRADPAILQGDPEFYARVASDNQANARAWTEFYAGQGPRPSTRHPSLAVNARSRRCECASDCVFAPRISDLATRAHGGIRSLQPPRGTAADTS